MPVETTIQMERAGNMLYPLIVVLCWLCISISVSIVAAVLGGLIYTLGVEKTCVVVLLVGFMIQPHRMNVQRLNYN